MIKIPVRSSPLRLKILGFVASLVLVCLVGSVLSLYRMTEVNRVLDSMNRVSIPLGRLFTQIRADAEIFQREFDRSFGVSRWPREKNGASEELRWRVRPLPSWVFDVLLSETSKIRALIQSEAQRLDPAQREQWLQWAENVHQSLQLLKSRTDQLQEALKAPDLEKSNELRSLINVTQEEWKHLLEWGAHEYDRSMRKSFSLAESRVSSFRMGLEFILCVVVLLSLLLLWLSDRALRPLNELTGLARSIRLRGLRAEDKALLPEVPFSRRDEVSELMVEFNRMATALLEREKIVDSQKHRLEEQNRMLREFTRFNRDILRCIRSILVVTDLEGKITQCNPIAAQWLGASIERLIGEPLFANARLQAFPEVQAQKDRLETLQEPQRIAASRIEERVYGGSLIPLRDEEGQPSGSILTLDDLTEEIELQDRLSKAENLAAVGRMSAQVAHEVRNPLHSIGLEAELALEMASSKGQLDLKQSLLSILAAVDRLNKITENYLKLSRISLGEKAPVDLGEVLESVLATYAQLCHKQGIRVHWAYAENANLLILGDRELLEQAFGNLFKNSIQALEGRSSHDSEGLAQIHWEMAPLVDGSMLKVKIQDNGGGVPAEVEEKLFEPFVTTKASGTGLGLSFIKKVIEDHDGKIRYTKVSEPFQGSCFEMELPLLRVTQEALVPPPPDRFFQERSPSSHA